MMEPGPLPAALVTGFVVLVVTVARLGLDVAADRRAASGTPAARGDTSEAAA
jgi:hypothetical protein